MPDVGSDTLGPVSNVECLIGMTAEVNSVVAAVTPEKYEKLAALITEFVMATLEFTRSRAVWWLDAPSERALGDFLTSPYDERVLVIGQDFELTVQRCRASFPPIHIVEVALKI